MSVMRMPDILDLSSGQVLQLKSSEESTFVDISHPFWMCKLLADMSTDHKVRRL
jgi:hypothetical protein